MTGEEQEALVLHQVAALQRSGLPRGDALNLAWETLGSGELADRIERLRTAMTAGQAPEGGAAFERVLLSGDPEALERAAAGIDAGLAAEGALRTTRLYLAIGLVVPIWLGLGLLAQLRTLSESFDQLPAFHQALIQLLDAVGWLWLLPFALALLAAWRLPARYAPSVGTHWRAAELLAAAATGRDPMEVGKGESERSYLAARSRTVGAGLAATELAQELHWEAERSAALFRHVAPLVAAALVFIGFGLAAALVFIPLSVGSTTLIGGF